MTRITRMTQIMSFYFYSFQFVQFVDSFSLEKLRGVSIQAGSESGTPQGASKLIIGQRLKEVKQNTSLERKRGYCH